MITAKNQIFIAILYFLIAASLGVILRVFPVVNVNATYKYLVHTHSHIALLGWVYISLTALIFHLFIKKEAQKKYAILFWFTQVTLLGMLFSFPITGYALFSIIFSTLFLICSYWFYAFFRKNNNCNKLSFSYKFVNTSLIIMIISSLGPWALGFIMNTLGNTSHWYKNAIYFYLHFQYNGWFIFCLLGLFVYFLERKNIYIPQKKFFSFYRFMLISCFLTLFLSFRWMNPPKFISALATLGVIYQTVALYKFHIILMDVKIKTSKKLNSISLKLFQFVYLLFVIKVALQFVVSIPYFAEIIAYLVDFVIGYLHLIFLGIISVSLFVFLTEFNLLWLSNFWIKIYLLGFILSEILIIYKGFCNWQQLSIINNYYLFLVIVSALMPLAILMILINNIKILFYKKSYYS